ncbi:MAG: hypothetical protein PHV13_00735 [Candidatus ainarchaeum sp.]|nr:hypothetical protein [Candidatus ainarchaeum sp.]
MDLKIIANPRKPWAKELAREVSSVLRRGHRIVKKGADATICIGGDGTILFANHQHRLEGPVLGIGGAKSYVCQLSKKSWRGKLLAILRKNRIVSTMTLDAHIGKKRYRALNDFVVHATHFRVAEIRVATSSGRKRRLFSFEGDGVIASTALGSAAYAYSAGGIKMAPLQRKISIVPICPYKRAFLPSVLSEKGKANITAGRDCAFIVDGIYVRRLKKGEVVRIGKGRDMRFFEGVGVHDWQG